ncbi:MAG: hypothetical protein QM692_23980 [Thermomicrobiales bacterium]
MIVARAPLRLSFGGGGTDLPAYYEPFGGFVVSSAITAACHVQIEPRPGHSGDVLLRSRDYRRDVMIPSGAPVTLDEPLSLPRAALAWFAARGQRASGITITTASDVAPGSGLGSSSAMTVALLAALACHFHQPMSPRELAAAACEVEIDLLSRPIGRQDQYASALGGLNTLTFAASGVAAQPLALALAHERALQGSLLLFATGRTRDSASVLGAQRAASRSDAEVIARLHQLKGIAHEMAATLRAGDIAGFGALLDASWQLKRGLAAGVTSADIDHWYALACSLGAYGGKIAGAGGGGHLLLCAPPERRAAISAALQRAGLRPVGVIFDHGGALATPDLREDDWRGDRVWKRELPDAALLHQP